MWRNNTLSGRTLGSIVQEFFGHDETKNVIYCDKGNGCGFGQAGRVTEYSPEWADLIMMEIGEPVTTDDGFKPTVQSEWQGGANGYSFRIQF